MPNNKNGFLVGCSGNLLQRHTPKGMVEYPAPICKLKDELVGETPLLIRVVFDPRGLLMRNKEEVVSLCPPLVPGDEERTSR